MSDVLQRLQTALSGRYDVRRLVGRGGMGSVYFAVERVPGRDVAIKVLDRRIADRILRERFQREIAVCRGLEHPHVVPIYDTGEVEELLFYVMPYLGAQTLSDRLEQDGRLGIAEAVDIAVHIAEALHYAHTRGVVHRDVKPGNILFLGERPVIVDFGVAAVRVATDERLTTPGEVLGTPVYMSPEQAMGHWNLDGRSDIYSLACVLYESLTGRPPFTAARPEATIVRPITEPPPHVVDLRSEVPRAVDRALVKALEWKKQNRFSTAAAFAAALRTT